MKKTILLLIIAIALIANLFCQEAKDEKYRLIGVKGGVNITRIAYDGDNSDANNRTGYFAGLFMLEQLGDNSLLGIDMLFSIKGDKSKTLDGSAITELRYLELPVHVKYRIRPKHEKVEMQPFIGLSPAILLKGISEYEKKRTDITKEVELLDLGMNLGVDFVLQKRLILGVNYTKGLTNIFKNSIIGATNSTLSCNLNIVF